MELVPEAVWGLLVSTFGVLKDCTLRGRVVVLGAPTGEWLPQSWVELPVEVSSVFTPHAGVPTPPTWLPCSR